MRQTAGRGGHRWTEVLVIPLDSRAGSRDNAATGDAPVRGMDAERVWSGAGRRVPGCDWASSGARASLFEAEMIDFEAAGRIFAVVLILAIGARGRCGATEPKKPVGRLGAYVVIEEDVRSPAGTVEIPIEGGDFEASDRPPSWPAGGEVVTADDAPGPKVRADRGTQGRDPDDAGDPDQPGRPHLLLFWIRSPVRSGRLWGSTRTAAGHVRRSLPRRAGNGGPLAGLGFTCWRRPMPGRSRSRSSR